MTLESIYPPKVISLLLQCLVGPLVQISHRRFLSRPHLMHYINTCTLLLSSDKLVEGNEKVGPIGSWSFIFCTHRKC